MTQLQLWNLQRRIAIARRLEQFVKAQADANKGENVDTTR